MTRVSVVRRRRRRFHRALRLELVRRTPRTREGLWRAAWLFTNALWGRPADRRFHPDFPALEVVADAFRRAGEELEGFGTEEDHAGRH